MNAFMPPRVNPTARTKQAKRATQSYTPRSQIHLGKLKGMDGFGLEVECVVEGVDQELVDAGHEVSSS